MPRRFPIFQFPNPPAIVAGVAAAAAWLARRRYSSPAAHRYSSLARLISRVALLVWAVEEVVDGANWFRRLLGLGGGAYALNQLRLPAESRRRRASAP